MSQNSVKKNMFSQYLLQFAKYVFPLITVPYLTRVLGPDVYAIRAYIMAFMTFVQVFLDFGFNARGTKVIAENRKDKEAVCKETSIIVVLRFMLFGLGALATFVITPFIPLMAANALYVLIAYIRTALKSSLPDFVFQGYEDMGIITHRFVVSEAVGVGLIFLLVKGPEQILLVPLIEAIVTFIASIWSWYDVIVVRDIRWRVFTHDEAKEAFKHSSIFFFSSAATTIYSSLTTLMIGIEISDPAIISYWSLSVTAIGAIQSLYTPITNSIYPHLIVTKEFSLLKKLLKIGIPVCLIGTIAFYNLADVVFSILGGSEYLSGVYVLQTLTPILFTSFIGMMVGFPVLVPMNEEKHLTMSSVIAAIFHIVGLVALSYMGVFTIVSVAILRNATEIVMTGFRLKYSWPYLFGIKETSN